MGKICNREVSYLFTLTVYHRDANSWSGAGERFGWSATGWKVVFYRVQNSCRQERYNVFTAVS